MQEAETYHVHKAICPYCGGTQEVDEGLEREVIDCADCGKDYVVSTDIL